MREIPQQAFDLYEQSETLVLRSYDDKHPTKLLKPGDIVEGKLTAGYGHTGADVYIGMNVTPGLAMTWVMEDFREAAQELAAKIGDDVIAELTDNQYAALLDFVLNLGTGEKDKPEWRIWTRLRAHEFDQVPMEMQRFVNWNGEKSEGLVRRRAAEVILWSTNEPGSAPSNPPSSVTRCSPTPPTSMAVKPPSRSAAILTTAAGAAAAGPPAINQVMQSVSPYSMHSEIVRHMLGILATAAMVLTLVGIAIVWFEKRRAQH